MKKQIVLSLGMIVFVAAVVAGGTGAFFSDSETSAGNVFTAGSVSLLISNIQHTYNGDQGNAPEFIPNGLSFELDDLKPLDAGSIDYQVLNGQNEAYVCAMVTETGNEENTNLDPEVDAGDNTTGSGNGELGDFLSFKFAGNSGTLASLSGVWQTVGIVDASTPTSSVIEYCFGDFSGSSCVPTSNSTDVNVAQTDSLTADIEFYAEQTRNNPDFTCDSLNQPDGPTITAGQPDYTRGAGTRIKGQNSGGEIFVGPMTSSSATPRDEVEFSDFGTILQDTYQLSFAFDSTTNVLTTNVSRTGGPSASTDFDLDTDGAPGCSIVDWDVMEVVVRDSRSDSGVALENIVLDTTNLGNVATVDKAGSPGFQFWTIGNFDFSNSFTVTADMPVDEYKGNEGIKVEFNVGCAV